MPKKYVHLFRISLDFSVSYEIYLSAAAAFDYWKYAPRYSIR